MSRISASHLPPGITTAERVIMQHEGVEVVAADLSAAQLDSVCTALREARTRLLDIPVSRVVRAIDAAARLITNPDEPERVAVLRSLHAITGLSDAMAAHVLDRIAQDWHGAALDQLLRDELGGPAARDAHEGFDGGRPAELITEQLIERGAVPVLSNAIHNVSGHGLG